MYTLPQLYGMECMQFHKWKEKGNHQLLLDEVKIINREEHWRIRHLKEAVNMLGSSDLLSRPSIEMNTIWERSQVALIKRKLHCELR